MFTLQYKKAFGKFLNKPQTYNKDVFISKQIVDGGFWVFYYMDYNGSNPYWSGEWRLSFFTAYIDLESVANPTGSRYGSGHLSFCHRTENKHVTIEQSGIQIRFE